MGSSELMAKWEKFQSLGAYEKFIFEIFRAENFQFLQSESHENLFL